MSGRLEKCDHIVWEGNLFLIFTDALTKLKSPEKTSNENQVSSRNKS